MNEMPSDVREEILTYFAYDPATGLVTAKITGKGRNKAGTPVGALQPSGYIRLQVKRKNYGVHRLAFLFVTGNLPDGAVDHINGDRSDNRFSNLRVVTHQQNAKNRTVNRSNRSGLKGVSFHKKVKKWCCRISYDGKEKHLGYFNSPDEAHEFYCLAADLVHGEFANHGNRVQRRAVPYGEWTR